MRSSFLVVLMCCIAAVVSAHNSYTGGYSGAPGMRTCASSCHGGSGGTLTVTGFPTTYQPGQTYRIAVTHNGGSPIVNFNATTRIGSTTTVAGSFTPVANSVLYTGADGGVYAAPHAIDSAVFQWTAPSSGTGPITLYVAAFQGTTSSSNGQNKAIAIASTEIVSTVHDELSMPRELLLLQNYPNPFNPTTKIQYSLPKSTTVKLAVCDVLGRTLTTLVEGYKQAGIYSVQFDASRLASGIYLCRLSTPEISLTRIMTMIK
jgi:hypothetical protein